MDCSTNLPLSSACVLLCSSDVSHSSTATCRSLLCAGRRRVFLGAVAPPIS